MTIWLDLYTESHIIIPRFQFIKLFKNFCKGDGKIGNPKRIGINNEIKSDNYVIIMDLDGTLIDSDSTNFQLLYSLLKKYKFEDKIKTIMDGLAYGTHFDEIMKQIDMPMEIRKKMDADMNKLLKKQEYKLLNGAKEVLKKLKEEGFKLAIATDNYYNTTIKFLQMNEIIGYFHKNLILASDNFRHQKPHKEVLQEIFNRSKTNNGILIGNSSKEIDFAKSVGLPIVLLDNFTKIDSDNPAMIYYQKIRQLSDDESYPYIYKAQSWDDIHYVVKNLIT